MFVGCSEISISVIVKQAQHVGIIRAFICLGGLINLSVPGGEGGQKKLLGCSLLGGTITQADKMFCIAKIVKRFVLAS